MNNWEYLWVIIRRDVVNVKTGDWYIELPDKTKILGKASIEEYINHLGSQGWEQVSSTGEHYAPGNWMIGIHLFFKRLK